MLSLFVAIVLILAACGSNSSGGSGSGGTGTGSNSGASTPGSSGGAQNTSGQKITIRFGHGSAESNARHQAALKFKQMVEERTNGQIVVEIFPNEQLGSEATMLQSVQSNIIEMTAGGSGIFASYNPQISILDLPYAFESFEQAWKVLDGDFGKKLVEPLIDQKIRVLAYWENGFRQITNNKGPIEKPEDLKGMKIRVPTIPYYVKTFEALGANPTPIAFGELFQALEQRIVDGQENPLTNIYNSKFYEVQKYLSKTNHLYGPLPLAISEDFWQTLSQEHQQIIQEAALEAAQFHRQAIVEDDKRLREELEKEGMISNDVDIEPFKEATKSVWEEAEKEFGKEFVDEFRKALADAK